MPGKYNIFFAQVSTKRYKLAYAPIDNSDQLAHPNGVARTLKSYAHQRETTVSSSDSLQ